MTAEHVVVPIAVCGDPEGWGEGWVTAQIVAAGTRRCDVGARCNHCLGDGRRALLDQAVPVERGGSTIHYSDGSTRWAWSEVER